MPWLLLMRLLSIEAFDTGSMRLGPVVVLVVLWVEMMEQVLALQSLSMKVDDGSSQSGAGGVDSCHPAI